MQITKYTHACIRLEHNGSVLVIDPGVWSEGRALAGADAVLVTHEHTDHIDVFRLAGLGVPVFVPADARLRGLEFTTGIEVARVWSGSSFQAAGFRVRSVGDRHARVHPEQSSCANLGYVIENSIYHPGDALHVPDQDVETLLVPVQASWLKTSEAIDFVRAVNPRHTYPIHEAQVNERGQQSIGGWLAEQTDNGFRWLAPGEIV